MFKLSTESSSDESHPPTPKEKPLQSSSDESSKNVRQSVPQPPRNVSFALTEMEWRRIRPPDNSFPDKRGRVHFSGEYTVVIRRHLAESNPYCTLKSHGMVCYPAGNKSGIWANGRFSCTSTSCGIVYLLQIEREPRDKVRITVCVNFDQILSSFVGKHVNKSMDRPLYR